MQPSSVMNAIERLYDLGQSVWLDFLDINLIRSGDLERLIQTGLRGVTSNPTIFEKALATGHYDVDVRGAHPGATDAHVLERIMVRDIQMACDRLRPVYEREEGRDGFASIEVSPLLAHDVEGTVAEAERLWSKVARPNVMIKIPATQEGVQAIFRSLGDGINVNITLLFSISRYLEVLDAYMSALEGRIARREPIDRLASVASFFVSRVDTKVDAALDMLHGTPHERGAPLRGRIAIANAKIAYDENARVCRTERWARLVKAGAAPQRLLWASTSAKDPKYGALHYVEPLVGKDTIDTMTQETIRALLDHSRPASVLGEGIDDARRQVDELGALGIDLASVTSELEAEGVRSFSSSFHKALDRIAEKRRSLSAA